MIVEISRRAEIDLLEIGDYIAQTNPERARSFVAQLIASASGLARNPRRFPLLPLREKSGIRRRVYGKYLIIYQIESTRVIVLRILHGARDYDALLFPDQ